jgi:hypothetical protein
VESNLDHFFFSPLTSCAAVFEPQKGICGHVFDRKDAKGQGKFGLIFPEGRGLGDLGYSSIEHCIRNV